ncbi:hypothetical protein D3C78_540190 [compost metagenome]
MQLDIQALGVQGLAIDANVTKVTQQQTIQLTVSTHHHEAVLLVGFERHAIHQVDAQQRRHGNRQVIIEERQHGLAVITTLSQLYPITQQRLCGVVHADALRHDVQQALNRWLLVENL